MIIKKHMLASAEWSPAEKQTLTEAADCIYNAINALKESNCNYYVGDLDYPFGVTELEQLHDELVSLIKLKGAHEG